MSRAGRLLLADGLVVQAELEEAARQQSLHGGTIGLYLVRAGVVRESTLTELFCAHFELEEADADELEAVTDELAALVPADVAVVGRVVPLELLGHEWLSVAMADPTDDRTVAQVARLTSRRLLLKVAAESDLSLTLDRLYGTSRPSDLPHWNAERDSRPTNPDDPNTPLPGDSEASTTRRFRAPIVLEGNYDSIPPEELPDDAEAGYFPLTQVKQRAPGERSSEPVIELKAVPVGADPELVEPTIEDAASLWEEPARPAVPSSTSDSPPPGEEPRAGYLPPSPVEVRSGEKKGRPAYVGVPGGDSWEVDDEPEPPEKEKEKKDPRPGRPKEDGQRDTLMDLPKIDPKHWSGPGKVAVDKLLQGIRQADSRDEAVQAALAYMASYCRRAAFFILKRGVVEGFDALGPNLSLDQVRSIWIPLSSRSTLCECVAGRTIRVGPIGDSRTDAIFCAAMGGRRGDSIIIPVTLGKRVVSVLYGDDVRGNNPAMESLEKLAEALSQSLGQMVVRGKKQDDS